MRNMSKAILMMTMGILVFAAVASAETVTISKITDSWGAYTPNGMHVDNNVSILSGITVVDREDRIWWGKSNFNSASSYVWNNAGTVSNPNISAVVDGDPFKIGLFTHNNKSVTGTPLNTVNLNLSFNVSIGGYSEKFDYQIFFQHDETTNSGSISNCAYVSTTACADKVTITAPFEQSLFRTTGNDEDGYTEYFFSLLGFKTTGNEPMYSWAYVTQENKANNAYLYAVVTTQWKSACDYNASNPICGDGDGGDDGWGTEGPDPEEDLTDAPEPASILLLGTGIIGLGLAARRKLGKK